VQACPGWPKLAPYRRRKSKERKILSSLEFDCPAAMNSVTGGQFYICLGNKIIYVVFLLRKKREETKCLY